MSNYEMRNPIIIVLFQVVGGSWCSDWMPCFPIALFGTLSYQVFPLSPWVHRFNASKHSISSGDDNEFLYIIGFPGSSDGKESACNAGDKGDVGSIPGLGRSPGEEDGNTLQYPCLENLVDRGAWGAIVHEVTESVTTEQLNHHQPPSGKQKEESVFF